MLRVGVKSIFFLITVFTLCTCVDPYSPKLRGYVSLLVVDGMITDEASSYTIRISRTIREQDAIPVMVPDATVIISDELGVRTELISRGDGTYKTDGSLFKGEIGRTYTLHINTNDGNEYESAPCMMQPVPDIDNIYFVKDQEIVNNGLDSQEGIRIFLDSKEGANTNYFRWDFEEVWKFKVPTPKKFDYINDSTIIPVEKVKEFGWKVSNSDKVLIRSLFASGASRIEKLPIHFIEAQKSNRLSMQYSILVRQYSISKDEYDFWESMIKVNNSGTDIFASQPFPVISNIHNVKNPGELVLGYFQVSAVKQKRMYISFSEITALNLPIYHYPCERLEKEPRDYKMSFGEAPTWDDVYNMFCVNKGYDFVEPKYIPGTTLLEKLVFAKPECADCDITGTSIKPDFWVDLN